MTVLWPLAQNCAVFLLNHAEHPSRHPSRARFGDKAATLPHKFTFFERVTYVRHASDLLNEKQQRFAPRGEAGLFGAYMRTSPRASLSSTRPPSSTVAGVHASHGA